MPSRSLVGKIWVTGTTSLIAFISYSSQLFVIWPWYGYEISVDLLLLLLPFNILIGLLYWNYFQCVKTDPGRVPKHWAPNPQANEAYEVKTTGNLRYCKTCDKYKPPRAHHCRQCRRCVLRMDHHCPWVDNCVGHYNYAHFIRFLFYVDVACSYHLVMVTARVRGSIVRDYWVEPSAMELIFIVLNYVFCVPVLIMVGVFSLYHFYCLCTNTTTIEGWEKNRVSTLIRRGKIQEVKFPYDLGIFRNIYAVLGDNPLTWCLPTIAVGDGLHYPLGKGTDPIVQNTWPPKDPDAYTRTHRFTLDGKTPWTYGDGLNPELSASNSQRRSMTYRGHTNVPPYHPDYRDASLNTRQDSSSESPEEEHLSSQDDEDMQPYNERVRRGSEGLEVLPVDREELLQHYIASRGDEATREYESEELASLDEL